ncbi:NADPH-dependent FMN reductase [Fructilactobacillus cliffordii]|uniref:NAD(P)H-dependent oxidoreductase n=1 Tax=Fructilactobacillus cliffordii TaxID=2940299 RepID=A0A9Q8ZP40_9LACO|nr:NADPH-dependent FMN reductase [Fructilactobacillus cliffordii]USS88990.1 NAD(P)H-dependent oxidoreductase [Fructilactobacillus cliffordii]
MTTVNVILGSVREPSMGERLFQYLQRNQAELEKASNVSLKFLKVSDYQLDPYTEALPPMGTPDYPNGLADNAKRWVEDVSAGDGILLLTPEYDYSVPGALKNAFDYLGTGVSDTPIQTISYSMGSFGGILASMAWLPVFQVLSLVSVPRNLNLRFIQNIFTETGELNPDLEASEQQYYAEKITQTVQNIADYATKLK